MKLMRKDKIKAGIGIVLIIALFFISSYYVQNNLEDVKNFLNLGIFSMVVYVLILIVATVVAPVNAMPLLPIASGLWGWFFAGLLSILGWTLGALIAFVLARRWGAPLVRKFVSLEKIRKFEKMIPEENIFWSIVFFRMAIPVDLLSYVLGLFSHIKFRVYALATLIGVSPLAFIFAYIGTLSFVWQILAFVIAVLVILIGYLIRNIYKKLHVNSKAEVIAKSLRGEI